MGSVRCTGDSAFEKTSVDGVEGGDTEGDGGSAGRSGGSSCKKLLDWLREDGLVLWFLTRSYNEGRAFRRGRKPTFIQNVE